MKTISTVLILCSACIFVGTVSAHSNRYHHRSVHPQHHRVLQTHLVPPAPAAQPVISQPLVDDPNEPMLPAGSPGPRIGVDYICYARPPCSWDKDEDGDVDIEGHSSK